MSCTQNPKSFLFIKYKGAHVMKAIRMGRFMRGSKDFIVIWECSKCGIQRQCSFVTEEELLNSGVSIDQIVKNRESIF